MLPNCEWNQKQKHKKQPWSNVECFAFGVWIVRFASLETSFHAANHTIPTPPSYEGIPRCSKAVFICFCFSSPLYLSTDPIMNWGNKKSTSKSLRDALGKK